MDAAFFVLVGFSIILQVWAIVLAMRLAKQLGGWAMGALLLALWMILFRRFFALFPPDLQGPLEVFLDRSLVPVGTSAGLLIFLRKITQVLHPTPLGMQEDPASVRLSQEDVVLSWNTQAAAMFGYTAREAIGKEFATLVVPEDKQEQHRAALLRYQLPPGTPRSTAKRFILEARHKRGHTFPVEVHVTAMREGQAVVFHGAIVRLSH